MNFTEILLEKKDGVARITINRPGKYNACTSTPNLEPTEAFTDAWVVTPLGIDLL